MTVLSLSVSTMVILAALTSAPVQERGAALPEGPETFAVTAAASTAKGGGSVTMPMTIQIDRYTPEFARTAMTDGLKYRGYPGFLTALRQAPTVGYLEVAGEKAMIRWARQEKTDTGRRITIVTDTPVYFIGAGRTAAKSTKGYEVAVVELLMDNAGKGQGTMAAAARVKPKDVTGVQVDDYAETPVKLTATVQGKK